MPLTLAEGAGLVAHRFPFARRPDPAGFVALLREVRPDGLRPLSTLVGFEASKALRA